MTTRTETAVHPLDPLTPLEMAAIVDTLRAAKRLTPNHLIACLQLAEPSKEVVAAWTPGVHVDRAARVAIYDREKGQLGEGIISVDGRIRTWRIAHGEQPAIMLAEITAAIDATKAHPDVRAALAKRGVTDIENLHIEIWGFGGLVPERLAGRRLGWTPMWARLSPDDNQYAHPIRGLYAVVDLQKGEVVEVEDHELVPVPQGLEQFHADQVPHHRQTVKPLEIHQPEGPGFAVEGWRVTWEKWSMRLGFCPREGLTIHDVWYDDDGTARKIAHRMSIAELVIPYGDPSPGHYRKNAFDTGEVGIGYFANSLELGCDCLGEIRYLDAHVVDSDGTIRRIGNAICLHEEDHGILWKHVDPDGHVEVRRSRRFVASFIVTVDNYEYAFYWYFYQDGAIEFECKLTGIVLTGGVQVGKPVRYGTEVAPGVFAPNHQHIFSARLDLDIDGGPNRVLEVDAVAPPWGPDNPYGGAFEIHETVLASEAAAQRDIDPASSRYWKVVNPERKNRMGHAVGYKLVPTHPTVPLALPDSSIGKRAAFIYHQLWVTPFNADERYPAGDYPYQHPGGAGLPAWTAADRPLEDTDVVLWHQFGTNHIPRMEDWPVMPVARTGFMLMPNGFFDRNPALDLPPPGGDHCHR